MTPILDRGASDGRITNSERVGTPLVPRPRCLWCTETPYQEVAVLKWRDEERERLTVPLCRKHLIRLKDAGTGGRVQKGWSYKLGWW